MRLRNIKGAREIIAASSFCISEDSFANIKGAWKKTYGDYKRLYVEIGMGKGLFLMRMAKENPDILYVGIEKYSSVLIRALEKQDEEQLPNLIFIRMDAESIEEVFDEGEVDGIYLNFSDPWPKDRHAHRRLTSSKFLSRYEKIISKEAVIEFKTDNSELFDYSLEEIKSSGWNLIYSTFDLHNNEELLTGNIMTEYEEKFSELGKPICKCAFNKF